MSRYTIEAANSRYFYHTRNAQMKMPPHEKRLWWLLRSHRDLINTLAVFVEAAASDDGVRMSPSEVARSRKTLCQIKEATSLMEMQLEDRLLALNILRLDPVKIQVSRL